MCCVWGETDCVTTGCGFGLVIKHLFRRGGSIFVHLFLTIFMITLFFSFMIDQK